MRIAHPSWLPALAVGWPLLAPVGAAASPFAQTAPAADTVTQARAIDLARQAAALAGYAPEDHRLAGVETDPNGGWTVRFERNPPGRPGGHCTVHVAADGSTRVVHGR